MQISPIFLQNTKFTLHVCEVQIVSGFAVQFTAQPGWPKIVHGCTSRIPGP